MSTCISRHGEYSDHEFTDPDDPFCCQRCFAFDEAAAEAERKRLSADLEAARAENQRLTDELGERDEYAVAYARYETDALRQAVRAHADARRALQSEVDGLRSTQCESSAVLIERTARWNAESRLAAAERTIGEQADLAEQAWRVAQAAIRKHCEAASVVERVRELADRWANTEEVSEWSPLDELRAALASRGTETPDEQDIALSDGERVMYGLDEPPTAAGCGTCGSHDISEDFVRWNGGPYHECYGKEPKAAPADEAREAVETPTSMQWHADHNHAPMLTEKDCADAIVAWIRSLGGDARYIAASGNDADMTRDPYTPARILVVGADGKKHSMLPGWTVAATNSWIALSTPYSDCEYRAFSVSDTAPTGDNR